MSATPLSLHRAAPVALQRDTAAAREARAVLAQMYAYFSFDDLPFVARDEDSAYDAAA